MPLPPSAGRAPLLRLRARPYFAAREEIAPQLPHLSAHCQEMWLKRLHDYGWRSGNASS